MASPRLLSAVLAPILLLSVAIACQSESTSDNGNGSCV